MNPQRIITKVLEKEQLHDNVWRLRLAIPKDVNFEFMAGQFMNIRVEGFVRRSYSIANPPHTNSYVETYVDTIPQGPGSKFCEQVEVGTEVDVLAPLGSFVYMPATRPVYFLATGTGITPLLSMIHHELETVKSGRRIELYYGVRYEQEFVEKSELEEWDKKYDNFNIHLYVSRSSEWQGNKGRITQGIQDLDVSDADAYLCGGLEMIRDMDELLKSKGMNADQIYFERFY